MNKRIQELADEAEDYADSIVDQGGDFHLPYTKKLAELIVKECAAVAWWTEQYDMGNGVPISKQINEHFGVEE